MSPSRRNEIEIMRDVLEVCMNGSNKTRIVYSANLNFTRLNRYLVVLLNVGFLDRETTADGGIHYKTTPSGACFVEGCAYIGKTNKETKNNQGTRGVKTKLA